MERCSSATKARCRGEVPPPTVGASICVVGDWVYVFGGRLVNSRAMLNDLYVMRLETLVWKRYQFTSLPCPKPRYFHSMDYWNDRLIVSGGMSTTDSGALCVLNDTAFLDLNTFEWLILPNEIVSKPGIAHPKPGYAHLSAICAGKLIVIGGQDIKNEYIEEMSVMDLETFQWIHTEPFKPNLGRYRSAAAIDVQCANSPIGNPNLLSPGQHPESSRTEDTTNSSVQNENHSPTSPSFVCQANRESYSPVYVYSNQNFGNVQRDLIVVNPLARSGLRFETHSAAMCGINLPPGLRFPNASVIGDHFILSGTLLNKKTQRFCIWIMNTDSYQWHPLDGIEELSRGSWNRGVLYCEKSKFLVFGNQHRNLVEDYNERRINFDHVVVIDLQAEQLFPSKKDTMSSAALTLGKTLLNDQTFCDMEILTIDQIRLPCLSKILCDRWPTFSRFLENYERQYEASIDPNSRRSSTRLNLSDYSSTIQSTNTTVSKPRENRFRTFYIPFSQDVCISLLYYLYTGTIDDHSQMSHGILGGLLFLAQKDGTLPNLRDIVVRRLIELLNSANAVHIFKLGVAASDTTLMAAASKYQTSEG